MADDLCMWMFLSVFLMFFVGGNQKIPIFAFCKKQN